MNKKKITEIIYKNSHDTSEGLVIGFEKIHHVIDLLSKESTPTHGRTAEEISLETKKALMEEAKKYSSVTNMGVTFNNPDKYAAFRDGQESGYTQAMHDFRNQPDYIQNRQEGVTKFLTVAEMKDFEQKVNTGEWSYSFMVETLCKMADSYRTQPQEGMEEVECTHPYKECVMSDRVNKYGTPLTKCSVCGNDNICDEELMDESVNTF